MHLATVPANNLMSHSVLGVKLSYTPHSTITCALPWLVLLQTATRGLAESYTSISWFSDIRGNLGHVKEKPARKICFSREMKRPHLLAKFC